ncbi:MAG: NUDIX hydrolase [Gammaproteobacteria bacterium]|nr:NUDIX hydrolase [Gammaproteobacteria bacterium]
MLLNNMRADQSNNQLPVVGVGAIVVHDGAVLLVKRGRAPYAGEWAIPGGKLKWGETLQQGAEREILEETGITIEAGELIYHFEHIVPAENGHPEFHYVVLDLSGRYISGRPQAADDAADARWIALDDLESVNLNRTTQRALNKLYSESN